MPFFKMIFDGLRRQRCLCLSSLFLDQIKSRDLESRLFLVFLIEDGQYCIKGILAASARLSLKS